MYQTMSAYQQFWRNCQSGIPAEVILGSPKTPRCKNLGICQIRLEQTSPQANCENRAVAYLRIDKPTGRLLIHFLNQSMSQGCLNYFFGQGVFKMKDGFILPTSVSSALMLNSERGACRVEKGDYLILSDDHFLTVSLRLSVGIERQQIALAA